MAVRKRLVIPGTTADGGAGGSERSLPPISREGYSTTKRSILTSWYIASYILTSHPYYGVLCVGMLRYSCSS